ncbi:MAG: hypothetical protein WCA35_29960 [Kovacikia sp.]
MKRLLWTLLAVGYLLPGKTAIAAPIVREMPQAQSQGLIGAGASLTVWAGSGTNIDFTRTGETIQRAWLDDPSLLTVDFDGSLCSRSAGNDCGGASIIHLRRITGIRFPNLPATNSTLLTVVTQSNQGKKIYLFNIGYGSGTPGYATVAITPSFQQGNGIMLRGDRATDWNTVEAGLTQAIQQHLILPDSPVSLRVRDFLTRVRSGTPMQQAIQDAKVTMAIISRLAALGNASPPVSQTQF